MMQFQYFSYDSIFRFHLVYHKESFAKLEKTKITNQVVGWPLLNEMVSTLEFKLVGHTMNKTYRHIINLVIQVKEAKHILIARPARKPQKILLCGWRRDVDDMIVVSSINQSS